MARDGQVSTNDGDVMTDVRTMPRRGRVLVAGIGNVFLGDDGFGVEVVRRLNHESLGEHVDVKDFGVRGVHLAFEVADGAYDRIVLVDATPRGGTPGTLYAIEPELDAEAEHEVALGADAHSLTPALVLAWIRRIAGAVPRTTVVGCEPESLDESMELSKPVSAAVTGAVQMVRELVVRPVGS